LLSQSEAILAYTLSEEKLMLNNSRRRIVAVLVVCAFAAFPIVTFATHSWGNYHWARTSNPFTLKLGDNVSSVWDPILATTSQDWSFSSVLNTTIVPGQANPKNCRPTSGRVEVCNSTYGNNGWLGIAQIWLSGGHISQGVVKLNDSYFNQPRYNSTEWRNLVSCQEVGHTFGLDHQDENFSNANLGTCMDYTNDPSSNQHPNQHDYDMLQSIYQHTDSTTTVGQTVNRMPPAASQIDMDGPGQWGRLVSGSREEGHSTYELDFGGGNKVLTHVFWAEGRGNSNHE
jgi:hypothetical protein